MKKILLFLTAFILLFSFSSCRKEYEASGKPGSANPAAGTVRIVIYDEIYNDDLAQKSALSVEKTSAATVYVFAKDSYAQFLSGMYEKTELMLRNSYSQQVKNIKVNDDISSITLGISLDDFNSIKDTVERATDIIGAQALKYQVYKNGENARLTVVYADYITSEILYEKEFSI